MSLTRNFDRLREIPDDDKPDTDAVKDASRYETPGSRRKLSYTDSDGKVRFFFYDEIRDGEYSPEENTITLKLYDKTVTLKGRNLAPLFEDIGNQVIKNIVLVEDRYLDTVDETQICVTQISIS